MTDVITEIGIGGIFAILVIREVLPFVKNGWPRNNGSKDSVTRTEFDDHKKVVQYRDNCSQIVKRIDGRFDDLKEAHKAQFESLDGHIRDVKALILKNNK